MSGRSAETVVQQDRHVLSSGEPEQLNGLEDRILAWAQLHYTDWRNKWQLVEVSSSGLMWQKRS
jgi:hypothetical protein